MDKAKCQICKYKFSNGDERRKFCNSCSERISKYSGRDRTREIRRMMDHDTCRKCGKKWNGHGYKFDVHHVNGLCGKVSQGYDGIHMLQGLKTLCHRCHCNTHTFKQHVHKNYRRKLTPLKIIKVKILRVEGNSIRRIAEKLNLSYPIANKAVKLTS